MTPCRPALRYFGGKWRLAPWIISHLPAHRIYCEAFGGGASVLMRKARSYGEVYNDLDGTVVNVFRMLQSQSRDLEALLRATPFSRDEFELSMVPADDPLEQARRTIILSFMGFGSDSITRGCRTGFRNNSNRRGTTAAMDWARYPDQLRAFRERLAGVVIENRDAIAVMASQDGPDTLFYVDPPYVHSTRSGDTSGYRYELTDRQHEDLLGYLLGVNGMVVLSGYASRLYAPLTVAGWLTLEVPTRVFGNQPQRTECLWLNPSAIAARAQQSLFREGAMVD